MKDKTITETFIENFYEIGDGINVGDVNDSLAILDQAWGKQLIRVLGRKEHEIVIRETSHVV